jgi:predicted NBD/HSP70 family sugar kinase
MKKEPISGDSSLLKSINKSTLLGLIRRHAPISRAELAKRTKLTRATVSALVEELIASHLVTETGIGESSGGRKPVLLEIDANAGYVIGFDVRTTDLLAIVANLRGEIVLRTHRPYHEPKDSDRVLSQIVAAAEDLKMKLPPSPLGLVGLGIGIPGIVEYPSGRVLFVPHFGWSRLDWKPRLEEHFHIPVTLDNEANLAALGELEAGAAVRCTEMLYISVGSGIGAGFILNGEIFRGTCGYAGEVGHTTIHYNGKRCTCGNLGCWEMYASEKALADQVQLPYEPGVSEQIFAKLRQGDTKALQAIREIGVWLGAGIGNMIYAFNPQMIVIGNSIARYEPWLDEIVEEAVKARFPFMTSYEVPIRYSALGEDAAARGAITLVILSWLERQAQM